MPATDNSKDKSSILKNTREAKGLTLEIVHEATKIPLDALRAIEEGYSSRILSPFYYRGFIKIYAEFLGLDVKEMYKQYGIDQAPKAAELSNAPVLKPKSRREESKPNVLIENAQELVSLALKPKHLILYGKITGALILLVLLVKMGGCIVGQLHKKNSAPKKHADVYVRQKSIVLPKPQEDKEEEKSAPPPVAPPEIKHEALQAQSQDDKVEVAVRAIKDTWIQVKADDKVVFQMTLNKGSMESWSAEKHIQLSGRNIEQLDMEVNGKHVGTLGGGERRIRRVMITKDGLVVKK